MTKEEIKQLKENKDIKFIYKIPCSLYDEGFEYIIIGDIKTEKKDNVRCFSLDDWFLRMKSGSLLPYVCATLSKSGKVKEYLNIYEKPNLLSLRNFLSHTKDPIELKQESLWGCQMIRESKINRPDMFKAILDTDKCVQLFLVEIDPMYRMSLNDK